MPYTYQSQSVFVGYKKQQLDNSHVDNYAIIVSSELRSRLIERELLSNNEAFIVLSKCIDNMLGLRIPDLKYLVLNNF